MATTTIASGSSAVVSVAEQQSIVLNNGGSDRARIEITTGRGAGTVVVSNHNGRRSYGPFGVGAITVYAISGAVQYEVGGDPSELDNDGQPLTPSEVAIVRASVTGARNLGAEPFYLASVMGDSIEQAEGGYTSDSNFNIAGSSWFTWFCYRSNGRVWHLRNAGIATQTTTQMLARFDADIPATTSLLFIKGGTNDIAPGSIPEATTLANIEAMVVKGKALNGGACNVVIVGIPPKNAAPAAVASLNRGYAAIARRLGVRFVNPWNAYNSGSGTWASGSSDGTHPNFATAYEVGGTMLDQLFGGSASYPEVPFILPTENADPRSRMYVSATANSCFMTDGNADGTPDGWNASTEITNTLVTATLPAIGKTLVMTGASVSTTRTVQRQAASAALTPGARHIAVMRIASTGVEAGGLYIKAAIAAAGLNVTMLMPVVKNIDCVMVVPFTAPANPGGPYMQFTQQPVSGTGGGVLRASQAEIYIASDLGLTV